jgi:hypothetical protein
MLGVDQVRELVRHWLQTRWRGARCAPAQHVPPPTTCCVCLLLLCCLWRLRVVSGAGGGGGKTLPLSATSRENAGHNNLFWCFMNETSTPLPGDSCLGPSQR